MKILTATICHPISLLHGSTGISWGAKYNKGLTANECGDYAIALREWTPHAKQGDSDAQSNLGVIYEKGRGVAKDYKTAVKERTLATEQGCASAQYNLGVMYGFGMGVLEDYVYAHM